MSVPSIFVRRRVFRPESGFNCAAYPLAGYGLGAAFISDTLAVSAPPDERMYFYRIDSPDVERSIRLFYKRTRVFSAPMRAFLKMLPASGGRFQPSPAIRGQMNRLRISSQVNMKKRVSGLTERETGRIMFLLRFLWNFTLDEKNCVYYIVCNAVCIFLLCMRRHLVLSKNRLRVGK